MRASGEEKMRCPNPGATPEDSLIGTSFMAVDGKMDHQIEIVKN